MIEDIKNADLNIDFNELLREAFIMACNVARETSAELLAYMDEQIRENINSKRYKFKKMVKKTILTPFGDLTFERAYYLDRQKDEYVYLLDEFLNIELDGKVTKDVLLRMVDGAAAMSYPKCVDDLKKKNIETSAGTIHNRMNDFLEKVNEAEAQRVERYVNGELSGKKEARVIFEEKDGIYLKIKGSKKKREMKAAKVYEGWEKVSPGSDEYRTVGTQYYAGYGDVEEFDVIVNSGIAEKYNVWKIEKRIINGDGASWISSECGDDANSLYQLDLFHIYSKASKKVKDEKARKELHKLIKEGKWDELILKSKELWEQGGKEEKEKLFDLYSYYNNHREALKRYWEVLSPDIAKILPNGEVRGTGTMESSIHNTLADRMKRVAWSEDGANAVAKSLSILHSFGGDQELGRIIYGRNFGFIAKGYIAKVLREKMNEAKKEVGSAVKDSIRENKKKRKYGGIQSHVEVFNGKISTLTVALRGLINKTACFERVGI